MSWLTGVFETGVGRGVGIMRHDGKAKEVEGEFSHDTLASDGPPVTAGIFYVLRQTALARSSMPYVMLEGMFTGCQVCCRYSRAHHFLTIDSSRTLLSCSILARSLRFHCMCFHPAPPKKQDKDEQHEC